MLEDIKRNIDISKVPRHVAIIMDGNGRWAQSAGAKRIYGHRQGLNAVRKTLEAARELSVKYLSLYVFSLENWDRPKEETSFLMDLLVDTLEKEVKSLIKNRICVKFIGNSDKIPLSVLNKLLAIEANTSTEKCTLQLLLAISYGGKWDIVNACKSLIKKGVAIEDIEEETIENELSTAGIPPPELLIRTGGEFRISNFLLWQLAYSELLFSSTYWPDFTKENFYQAIVEYQKRERRFGKISDQII